MEERRKTEEKKGGGGRYERDRESGREEIAARGIRTGGVKEGKQSSTQMLIISIY